MDYAPGTIESCAYRNEEQPFVEEFIVLRLVEGAVANTIVGAPVGGIARLMKEEGGASRGRGRLCMEWLHRTQSSGDQGRRGERGMGLDDIW